MTNADVPSLPPLLSPIIFRRTLLVMQVLDAPDPNSDLAAIWLALSEFCRCISYLPSLLMNDLFQLAAFITQY
jgi:hypothetical protein